MKSIELIKSSQVNEMKSMKWMKSIELIESSQWNKVNKKVFDKKKIFLNIIL